MVHINSLVVVIKRLISLWKKSPLILMLKIYRVMLATIKAILFLPLVYLFILVIFVLRPFVKIRFKMLIVSRIGHLAAEPAVYLSHYALQDNICDNFFDIFYYNSLRYKHKVCNFQLLNMLKRRMCIINAFGFVWLLHGQIRKVFSNSCLHEVHWPATDRVIDNQCVTKKAEIQLKFNELEIKKCEKYLADNGIVQDFVCFFNRDAKYLQTLSTYYLQDNTYYDYHNFRDSSIANYIDAAKKMNTLGVQAVRLGKEVSEKINVSNNKIFDYASSGDKSDLFDIYLMSKCKFIFGAVTGFIQLGVIFKKPTVLVNSVPLLNFYRGNAFDPSFIDNIFIFKKYKCKKRNIFMPISEMLKYEFFYTKQYAESNIEVIENSSEEISDVVLEMNSRLNGEWIDSKEDIALQDKFWQLVEIDKTNSCKVGANFLKKNQWLLC